MSLDHLSFLRFSSTGSKYRTKKNDLHTECRSHDWRDKGEDISHLLVDGVPTSLLGSFGTHLSKIVSRAPTLSETDYSRNNIGLTWNSRRENDMSPPFLFRVSPLGERDSNLTVTVSTLSRVRHKSGEVRTVGPKEPT